MAPSIPEHHQGCAHPGAPPDGIEGHHADGPDSDHYPAGWVDLGVPPDPPVGAHPVVEFEMSPLDDDLGAESVDHGHPMVVTLPSRCRPDAGHPRRCHQCGASGPAMWGRGRRGSVPFVHEGYLLVGHAPRAGATVVGGLVLVVSVPDRAPITTMLVESLQPM